jgi:Rab proteins geranylgeranyltransferase component A
VLYLTTLATSGAKEVLERALDAFIGVTGDEQDHQVLFQLQYDQQAGSGLHGAEGPVFTFPAPSLSLSFDDSTLEPVREAWQKVMGDTAVESEYLTFEDREGAMDDDDVYE